MGEFWEDFAPGWSDEVGPHAVTATEMLALADAGAAAISAIAWRMGLNSRLRQAAMLGSTTVQRLALRAPVRPGDRLTLRTMVVAVTPLADRTDRGVVDARYELRNDSGTVVLEMDGRSVLQRRRAGGLRSRRSP